MTKKPVSVPILSDLELAEMWLAQAENLFYSVGGSRRGEWRQRCKATGWHTIGSEQVCVRVLRWLQGVLVPGLITPSRIRRIEQLARLVSGERQGM